MRYRVLTGLAAVGVLLVGCDEASETSVRLGAASGQDTCNAAAYQELIGQEAATSLTLPEPKRLIGPTDAVTTDFLPNRLNVQLDDTDNIIAITCG